MDETILKPGEETLASSSDETKISAHDKTKGIAKDDTCDDQTTLITIAEGDDFQETLLSPDNKDKADQDTTTEDRTSILFGISDIQQKLDIEIANIPEEYEEHIEPEQMSHLIKDHYPTHTEAEKIRVNRNFLNDAEPFRLDLMIEKIKNSREGLPTGFKSLDHLITIPSNSLTLIVSRPKHGKTCFMLNLLLNMCHLFPGKRFLFYTYEEPKWDVFLKLINMSGTKQFTQRQGRQSNLERWEYELNHCEIETLKEKANEDIEYIGLKNFLEIAGNVHVIDSNHNCGQLIDSIRSFAKTFDIGAVFIDSLPKIRLEDEKKSMDYRQQLQEISDNLRKLAAEIRLPLILSAPLTTTTKGTPEYDNLVEENLVDLGCPDQNANLVIGLQNYARSKFIGSNTNNNFKSNFLDEPLKNAAPMPDNFKDMGKKTILLAKVIANKTGPETETELIFHKQLLKITDPRAEI
ncbi:MAG: primase [Acidobacteriota bacterium]|nr:primase [Acidobacteriota bacterium]